MKKISKKTNSKLIKKLGFSLIELSVVMLIIAILVAGATVGTSLISNSKLVSTKSMTSSSPVSSISGLRLWLESTSDKSFDSSEKIDGGSGGSGTITNWYDINPQSKNGYKATQSTINRKPFYTRKAINGLPAIKFQYGSGPGTSMNVAIQIVTSNQLEVFMVMQRISVSGGSNNYGPFSFYTTSYPDDWSDLRFAAIAHEDGVTGIINSQRGNGFGNLSPATHPGNGIPYVYSTRFNGTDNLAYLNGAPQTASSSTGNFGFDNILIGSRWEAGVINSDILYNYNGYIGELIIFNRALATSERDDVTKYLGKKWGIKVQ